MLNRAPHLLTCVLLLSAEVTSAPPGRSIPLRSKVSHVQPMTGIVLWSDNENAVKYAGAITLEYRYCGYNEVVNERGEYDFAVIDSILDQIARRNHQAILRFYFCYVGKETTVPDFIRRRADYHETIGLSEKRKTHFCDWSNQKLQEFTLDFYAKFAERYDDDPRIAFLQTGFGLWAEYHIYSGPRKMGKTFPSKTYQAKFLRHLNQQFDSLPWSISIDAADYDYTPLEENAELLALNFGLFDDSFLCKPHPRENAVNWKILGPARWQRQPAGGEFSYYNNHDQKNALRTEGPNGVSFEEAARKFHISYMIGNDQPRYRPVERIREAGMATGYRFRITAATYDANKLRLTVTNDGTAPIYRDAFVSVGAKRSLTSLRGLLPGDELVCAVPGVDIGDLRDTRIECDAILPSQTIQYDASLSIAIDGP